MAVTKKAAKPAKKAVATNPHWPNGRCAASALTNWHHAKNKSDNARTRFAQNR
jgi:hypothetical protein